MLQQPPMVGADLADEVTTAEPYVVPAEGEKRFTVVALDLGIKSMTPKRMAERGIEVHVLPATATLDEVLAVNPDGIFMSNGPGDPETTEHPTTLLKELLQRGKPYFGICFGNQVFGRALGLGTFKLKYGHRGINQPVLDRATGKVEITAQNHGFAVDAPLDETVETPYGTAEVQSRVAERQRGRGAEADRARRPGAGVLGAVPPGGGGRSARLGVPVRPVRRTDGRRRA